MKTSDFYYDLPEDLIAQTPAQKRDHSNLLVVDRCTGYLEHRHFYDILDYFNPGDCLVLNDSKVLPCRIYGIKKDTGAKVEFLLLNDLGNDRWECITGPGKRARKDSEFSFGEGLLTCKVEEVLSNGNRIAKFRYNGIFLEVLEKIGEMPLPHYITEKLEDKDRYQTVFANVPGSAAAPTAGLHYTKELLEKIAAKGVKIVYITLNVGIGTFRPVKAENIEDHEMHFEHYSVSKETADTINSVKEKGGRIFCNGTTSCRTLESCCDENGFVKECSSSTNIFIYPGYKFKCIDCLITNFHLPESTLVMLVSAFSSKDIIMNAYKDAIENRYRFFSFGDAMLLNKSADDSNNGNIIT